MIRLWKVGDHKEGILPNEVIVDKLAKYLAKDKKGEVVDIVWDTMISITIIDDNGNIRTEKQEE